MEKEMAASIRRSTTNSTPEKEAPTSASTTRNYTEAERRFMERQRKMVWVFFYIYYWVFVLDINFHSPCKICVSVHSTLHRKRSQWIVLFQEADRILKKASKTHKEKVEDFNRHLDSLTEHFDIPKVSWTKWSALPDFTQWLSYCCHNVLHQAYSVLFCSSVHGGWGTSYNSPMHISPLSTMICCITP